MKPSSDAADDTSQAQLPRSGATVSFARSIKEIGWAFLGIRKHSGSGRIGALQLVAVALVAVALFVLALIALVHLVVRG